MGISVLFFKFEANEYKSVDYDGDIRIGLYFELQKVCEYFNLPDIPAIRASIDACSREYKIRESCEKINELREKAQIARREWTEEKIMSIKNLDVDTIRTFEDSDFWEYDEEDLNILIWTLRTFISMFDEGCYWRTDCE